MTKLFKYLGLGFAIILIAAFPLVGAINTDSADMTDQKDVVDTVTTQDNFATFALLLNKSGLVGALKGQGPFTVFAPTDEAFEALGEEKLESLLMPNNSDKLKSILLFHVVPQKIDTSKVDENNMKVKTLEGQDLSITKKNGKLMVDDATVVAPKTAASNGTLFIIDKVLLPPNTDQ